MRPVYRHNGWKMAAEKASKTSNRSRLAAQPQVTVIIPAYNVGKYIGEAVDSVLCQTFTNFEFIVIDDGSTDDTAAIALEHGGGDPRFDLVTVPHCGAGAARNVGIRHTKAEFIAFLDGDDRWHRSFLASQLGLMRARPEPVGVVFCRSRMILENGTPVFVQWQRAGGYDFDDFLVQNDPARNGSSLLIRRSCFEELGGFNESMPSAQDFDMWLRIARESATPVLWANRRFLVDLRLRPGSISRDRTARDEALQDLLEANVARLRRLPAALAYVRPAMTAIKYDTESEISARWESEARSAGVLQLVRSLAGIRFLFWSSLPPSGRRALRSAQGMSREVVKRLEKVLRG
jgi:glycosyltransferase involved in cell wall biosynthesis